MHVFRKTVDLILPPRCPVTGQEVDTQGMLAPEAWADLRFIADPKCSCCGFPFDFDSGMDGALCAACLESLPLYDSARAALVYDDRSRDLVLGFKHGDQMHAVRAFLPWLKTAGAEFLEYADYLVPVPLYRWRLLRRRYNQAAIIAQALAQKTNVICLPDALIRTRSTPSQGYLKAREREKNVRGAFEVNPKQTEMMKDKTIVLVDDVYTTGATVEACTKSLKKAGASAVHVLTLARVVKPEYIT